MSGTYLLIDFASLSIPLLFSFHPRLRFDKTWHAFFPAMIVVAIFFLVWDALFTDWGVWSFNHNYVVGVYVFGLPIEELLFFICIPFSCVFTYHALNRVIKSDVLRKIQPALTLLLIAGSIATAITFSDRLYTFSTFALLAVLLIILRYWKVRWLSRFYLAYCVVTIPFLIVNGLLTGTGLSEAIVSYNNSENVGVRIMTIPVEDWFYGMLLILMNVTLYELIAGRRLRANSNSE